MWSSMREQAVDNLNTLSTLTTVLLYALSWVWRKTPHLTYLTLIKLRFFPGSFITLLLQTISQHLLMFQSCGSSLLNLSLLKSRDVSNTLYFIDHIWKLILLNFALNYMFLMSNVFNSSIFLFLLRSTHIHGTPI